MEFDRKTIFAFVLIGLILILINTDFYQRMMLGDLPKPQPVDTRTTRQDSMAASREHLQSGSTPTFEIPESEQSDKAATDLSYERSQARTIQISTQLYSATFSTLGATPISWQFKEYLDAEGNPVTLFKDGENNLAIQLPMAEDTLNTGALNFKWENAHAFGGTIHLETGQTQELIFTREIVAGKYLRKIFMLSGDEYTYRFKIEFVNLQDIIQGYSYLLSWQTPLESTEQSIAEDMSYTKAYALANKELEEFDVGSKTYATAGNNDWATSWAAIRTKYFTVAAIPDGEQGTGVQFVGRTAKETKIAEHKRYEMHLAMPLYREGQAGHSFIIYTGPLDYKTVKGLGVELERMMNLGWKVIQPFSVMILWMFTFLHKFIPNYGVVIVVFSILVKIVLHPLTKKSYQSMKEMQELQPQMTAMREKYSNDPQKMNAEIMKLYKEHGVNPLGGCLPMLLQMPLLYALFIVFRSTIELRQAHFVGWITDLSAPDAIFKLPFSIPMYGEYVCVLPVIMGVTMLIQQAMTIKDPKQKFMVYFMPILFTLLFNSFPSGLNLYYTLFNVFSILQQKYITTAPVTEKKAKKKKSYREVVSSLRRSGLNALLSQNRRARRK